MTVGELCNFLVDRAKESDADIRAGLVRNRHMHRATQAEIDAASDEVLRAAIVGYINKVAYHQCCDLALYTDDVRSSVQKETP